jgi:uncharacterized membrane protein YqjE
MAGEDSAAAAKRASGLLGSIRNLAATLAAIAQTRLELLANEFQEEGLRLRRLLLLALVALFFLLFGVMLLTLLVIALFWDSNRVLAIGAFAALYLVIGMVLAMMVRNRAAARSHLFEASLAELKKDHARLSP